MKGGVAEMLWGVIKIVVGFGTFALGFFFGFLDVWRGAVAGWLLGSGIYDLYDAHDAQSGKDTSAGQHTKRSKIRKIFDTIMVMAAVGIIIVHQFSTGMIRGQQQAAYTQLATIQTALDSFRIDTGRYPTTGEGLIVLINNSSGIRGWSGPYLKGPEIIIDPWNNSYHYKSPGVHGEIDLYSYGADNKEGGTGEDQDIINWRR